MENTWKKDYVAAAIMGEGCPGVTTPHFLAVWRSKELEVAVHLYTDPLFLPACLLQWLHATVSC